jgi:hypothetical protein
MENSVLTLQSANTINDYTKNSFTVRWEREMVAEVLAVIEKGDAEKLAWFNAFGKDLRHIIMNVHAYRKGLEFGFTSIAFDQYHWFSRPEFLDMEDIKLGWIKRTKMTPIGLSKKVPFAS